jgi:hypothetical protein
MRLAVHSININITKTNEAYNPKMPGAHFSLLYVPKILQFEKLKTGNSKAI